MPLTAAPCFARCGIAALLLCVALGSAAAPLRAQAPSPSLGAGQTPEATAVVLRTPACASLPFEVEALVERLRVELTVVGVQGLQVVPADWSASAASGPLVLLELSVERCEPPVERLVLAVSDAVTAKRVEREVGLRDVEADARPRALAIALSELLQASWSELWLSEPAPGGPAAPEPAMTALAGRLSATLRRRDETLRSTVDAESRAIALEVYQRAEMRRRERLEATARERARQIRMAERRRAGAELLGRAMSDLATGTLGGRAIVSWAVSAPSRVQLGASYERGQAIRNDSTGARIGQVTTHLVGADVALLWSSATRPRLELGPRVMVGYLLTSASVDALDRSFVDRDGAVINAALSATLVSRLDEGTSLLVGLDLGHALVGQVMLIAGERAIGLSGPNAAARIGLAFSY